MNYSTSKMRCLLVGWLALLQSATTATSIVIAADNPSTDINRQLLRQAPDILKQLRDKGYRNVGILKFRIKKGDKAASDRIGTLNIDLANRLEMALILKNNAQNPLGIIHDASSVAATIKGANHLTADGRQKLFSTTYPLAWGRQKVTPDAFLIGVAEMTGNLGQMTIGIAACDRQGGNLARLCQFTAKPTVQELSQAGESFVLRGVFDQGAVKLADEERAEVAETEAIKEVALIKEHDAPTLPKEHPLAPANPYAPVALKIYYDDYEVPYEFKYDMAAIPEPNQYQKVKFVLIHKLKDHYRYAITLKVNGENTIARQHYNDYECRKWVLSPEEPVTEVPGFQIDGQTAQEFRVLSPYESKEREMDYGRDVGTISISVYRERSPAAPALAIPAGPEDEDFAILQRDQFPVIPVPNFVALQQELRRPVAKSTATGANSEVRGLIGKGETIVKLGKKVSFDADPIPVLSGVITYYHPQHPQP